MFSFKVNKRLFYSKIAFVGNNGPGQFKCKECGKVYPSHKKLSDHSYKDHKQNYDVTCEICGKSVNKRNYKKHKVSAHARKNLQCSYCSFKTGETHLDPKIQEPR